MSFKMDVMSSGKDAMSLDKDVRQSKKDPISSYRNGRLVMRRKGYESPCERTECYSKMSPFLTTTLGIQNLMFSF